jgi:hypothetical protein
MKKQRWEESEKRREEERRSENRTSQKTDDAGARKGSKVAILCVFPMICGSGGSKSRLAGSLKRRVRSQLARRLPKANALLRQVQESKGNEFWEAVLQMLDVKNVCDLSPGSGTLASTCLRMQIPYLGILRSDAHHSYWGNVLDQCLQYLSHSNSILYNESLSELIQEHFAETLTELNEPDVDDASDHSDG